MILFKKATTLTTHLHQKQSNERTTGFVPTMGALHPGHLSLLQKAKAENDRVVCSIFINPTQFNNPDDYKHYPVTIEKDLEVLTTAGCDVLFLPTVNEIYPQNYQAPVYDLGHLETVLEGTYRPGHFQGVCQVVERLLRIVRPSKLYLGQKDYQQCMVIQRLLQNTALEKEIDLKIAPTLREADGLAMSSRNLRLSPQQRPTAVALYQTLLFAKENLTSMNVAAIKAKAFQQLTQHGFAVDYFEIADAATLMPSSDATKALVALVAAHLGNVRLIDNLPLN